MAVRFMVRSLLVPMPMVMAFMAMSTAIVFFAGLTMCVVAAMGSVTVTVAVAWCLQGLHKCSRTMSW